MMQISGRRSTPLPPSPQMGNNESVNSTVQAVTMQNLSLSQAVEVTLQSP